VHFVGLFFVFVTNPPSRPMFR